MVVLNKNIMKKIIFSRIAASWRKFCLTVWSFWWQCSCL